MHTVNPANIHNELDAANETTRPMVNVVGWLSSSSRTLTFTKHCNTCMKTRAGENESKSGAVHRIRMHAIISPVRVHGPDRQHAADEMNTLKQWNIFARAVQSDVVGYRLPFSLHTKSIEFNRSRRTPIRLLCRCVCPRNSFLTLCSDSRVLKRIQRNAIASLRLYILLASRTQ